MGTKTGHLQSEDIRLQSEDLVGHVWYLGGWTLVVDTEQYCDAVTLQEQTQTQYEVLLHSTTVLHTLLYFNISHGHMMSYRSEYWGRGDDDVMEAAGGSAHSVEVLPGCRGRGCYLSRWLQRQGAQVSNS